MRTEPPTAICLHGTSFEICRRCFHLARLAPDPYTFTEVSGQEHASELRAFNGRFPAFDEPLRDKHLGPGTFWWLVHSGSDLVAFAGMVPFEPFPRVGYLKRAAVLPSHRGHGLQGRLIALREERARTSTDWTHLVTESALGNPRSGNSLIRAGYRLVEAERPWAKETLFWRKAL